MFKKIKHVHFVGIGGSGMSGIAEVLIKLGYQVSGSDLVKNAEASRLGDMGASIHVGHAGQNVDGADVVVTSTAISKTNPEVKEAHRLGIPVIPRIEMLAEIARLKYTIAIAGTHGKTTTSSVVGHVLKVCGLDPTVIVGGKLKAVGTGGVLGQGDYLVAEADESDGSFLKLSPTINVITNIDNDHLDYYKTEEKLIEAFVAFANRVPFYGITFICAEDKGCQKIISRITRRYATYGFQEKCDLRAVDINAHEKGSSFKVLLKGRTLGPLNLPLFGRHNILNALAVVAVGLQTDLTFEQIASAISQFTGVGRRLETRGELGGVAVIDDYGHHPTEMKATLSALRQKFPGRRLVVIFQPHRFSRTKLLHREFAAVLKGADKLYLMPIYPAGEKPLPGVTSQLIARGLKKLDWTRWSDETSMEALVNELKAGDVLVTMGAGSVWKLGDEYLRRAGSLAQKLRLALPSLADRIKADEPLSRHCTWAIGGPAQAYFEARTLDELKQAQDVCLSNRIPVTLLGWGSNVLFPDEGLRGCVIRLKGDFEKVEFEGTDVRVGAGVHLPKLAHFCVEKGLSGVECLAGVPGTVGGALVMNAGTPRGVMGDVVHSVDILNSDGSVATLPRDKVSFTYRHSSLEGQWVVGALLRLRADNRKAIQERIQTELNHRQMTQPLGTKNAGSVFRNPDGDHAARLIEAAGLKGMVFGHVRVSPKHANFFENTGGGTCQDMLGLMSQVRQTVKDKFNIDLQPEVKVIKQAEVLP